MRKSYVYIIIIVVVVAAAGIVWYAMANKTKKPGDDMSSMNMSSSGNSNSKPVATNAVTIQDFAFSPANITVKAGTKITWTNKDSVAHTVTETDGLGEMNSGDINPGSSYSYTFSKTGTFRYQCAIHPNMTGTIMVTN